MQFVIDCAASHCYLIKQYLSLKIIFFNKPNWAKENLPKADIKSKYGVAKSILEIFKIGIKWANSDLFSCLFTFF